MHNSVMTRQTLATAASEYHSELPHVFGLERLERDLFRGESRDLGLPQVFGGQVLGQALAAAYGTIAGRTVHSLHAYFLRRGDCNASIVYQVERTRDGSSFSSRRVIATQHGEQILNLAASFQVPEDGFEHQMPIPDVTAPEDLPDEGRLADHTDLSQRMVEFLRREKPFEFRFIHSALTAKPAHHQQFWFRAKGRLPQDDPIHHCLLTYVSDYYLLFTATGPHGMAYGQQIPVVASIDHALWFHRPVRVDEWLLYSMESPSASGSRGFARASIFARSGQLIASAAQEGLMRRKDKERLTT